MEIYNATGDQQIITKDDNSPLTLADLASHKCIMKGLEQITEYPIISEEAKLPSYEERKAWTHFWLVDPLDGTKEFIKKNGEFTVPGFGKLKKTHRKARDGRNPATGAVIKIPAKTTVKFAIGKAMKDSVG